ncbi:MAG: Lrp/AsnC ligand binding domain-containing protein [Candidatus Odinarchaeota archaeon]|nr:Lrp/AsnC ligand binding domain-containing protein [Candidatus Odinarchaeota archaeon]
MSMGEELIIAYVLLIVSVGEEDEVSHAIKNLEGVKEVFNTYGSWDMIIRVEVNDIKDLDKVVASIRKVSGVEYTETLICTKK